MLAIENVELPLFCEKVLSEPFLMFCTNFSDYLFILGLKNEFIVSFST